MFEGFGVQIVQLVLQWLKGLGVGVHTILNESEMLVLTRIVKQTWVCVCVSYPTHYILHTMTVTDVSVSKLAFCPADINQDNGLKDLMDYPSDWYSCQFCFMVTSYYSCTCPIIDQACSTPWINRVPITQTITAIIPGDINSENIPHSHRYIVNQAGETRPSPQ